MAKGKTEITKIISVGEEISPADIKKTIMESLSRKYELTGENDSQYGGMTCYEVALHKAVQKAAEEGDFKTLDSLLNRVIGKPMQLSLSAQKDLNKQEDWLKTVYDKEKRVKEIEEI